MGCWFFARTASAPLHARLGGGGAWALGARGHWSCSIPSLEANLSANGNKITNLAAATASGDALGYGQTAGGDLSGALPNAIVQTVLNGRTPVYSGQTKPQFQTFPWPFVVGSTTAGACALCWRRVSGTRGQAGGVVRRHHLARDVGDVSAPDVQFSDGDALVVPRLPPDWAVPCASGAAPGGNRGRCAWRGDGSTFTLDASSECGIVGTTGRRRFQARQAVPRIPGAGFAR